MVVRGSVRMPPEAVAFLRRAVDVRISFVAALMLGVVAQEEVAVAQGIHLSLNNICE